MPVFDYSALDAKGKTITGIIDADGASAARQKIRADGHYPVKLREVKDGATEKREQSSFALGQIFSRIRPSEIAIMTRQLATLIGAGFPLVSALEALMEQFPSPSLKKMVAKVKDAVVEGTSFADALNGFPSVFSNTYVNMVRVGETSGTLEIVLNRLADITEKQEELKNRVISAMIYPLVILIVAIVIMGFMFAYVIPNITSIFDDVKADLPLPTEILIGTSNIFKSYWWLLSIIIVGVFFCIRTMRKNEAGRRWMDKKILTMPFAGTIAIKLATARFARTLGSLLENGVSMLPAMDVVKKVVGNVYISEIIELSTSDVGKGVPLHKSLDTEKVFPPLAIQMIMVGEQSGSLETMLNKVADVFEKEVETTIMRMTALLEPVMVVVMAAMVLFIMLSIFLPILEMSNVIG